MDDTPAPRRRFGPVLAAAGVVAALVGVTAWGLWAGTRPPRIVLEGQLDAEQVNVAAKVPGRVARVLVTEGQRIEAQQQLIEMDAPEIAAKVQEAQAVRAAAQALNDKAHAGARSQEIRMAELNWRRAESAAVLAEKTFRRVDGLARDGLIAAQKRDEAETQWKAAADLAGAAHAQYEMAKQGARVEDKAAAAAQLRQAQGVVAEAEVAVAESRLASPVGGEVTKVYAKPGEISPAGVPVATITVVARPWVVLNVREDLMPRFRHGAKFDGDVPALAETGVAFEVFYVAAQPDFATWRSTKSGPGFDARTFEVRARPLADLKGARPGMSVLVPMAPAS
jgi:HlyD family secretion protein